MKPLLASYGVKAAVDELEIGDVVAFRDSDSVVCVSRRATFLGVEASGKASRKYLLEFDDGRTRKVPRARIKGPWELAEEIDEAINFRVRLNTQTGDEDEQRAASALIEESLGDDVIQLTGKGAFIVVDSLALEYELGMGLGEVFQGILTLESEEGLQISPLGGICIAKQFCKVHPARVLDLVARDEERAKIRLREHQGIYSARSAWEFYVTYERSRTELLRYWCGYAAVKDHERAAADAAEVNRLAELLQRLIQVVEKEHPELAKRYLKELITEEITPYTVRESPDRPLEPHEIPVRIEYRRRNWG